MKRRCLEPGCSALTTESRCPPHARRRRAAYGGEWPRISREAIAAHRAVHGNWCPGWGVDPHPSADLTADHVNPLRLDAGVRVLCRACNGRRGDREA